MTRYGVLCCLFGWMLSLVVFQIVIAHDWIFLAINIVMAALYFWAAKRARPVGNEHAE